MFKFSLAVWLVVGAAVNVTAQELPPPDNSQSESKQEVKEPESLVEKWSFLAGYDIFVQEFKMQGVEVDVEQLIAGIRKAAKGEPPAMSDEEIRSVMTSFRRKFEEQQQARWENLANENKQKGEQFLAENAKKEGVQTLENGLQYHILTPGAGESPRMTSSVRFHVQGSLIDGTVFESTRTAGQPLTSTVGGVPLRGVSQALLRMKVGSKWRVVIPSDLAYGPTGNPPIGPNQTLVYEIELVEIVK